MGRPVLFPFLLAAALILPAAQATAGRPRTMNEIFSIIYDKDLNVRTEGPPPSEVKSKGRPLTKEELQDLKDKGLPGYRAAISDLSFAWYVTIYLEKKVVEPGGKVKWEPYPPQYCLVHHNRLSTKSLVLYHQIVGFGNPPPPYLIGAAVKQGNGIPFLDVRLKTVLVHSFYTPPRR